MTLEIRPHPNVVYVSFPEKKLIDPLEPIAQMTILDNELIKNHHEELKYAGLVFQYEKMIIQVQKNLRLSRAHLKRCIDTRNKLEEAMWRLEIS